MKNKNTIRYLSNLKGLLLVFFVLLSFSNTLFAQQSGIIFYWDSHVGCLSYEEERVKEIFIETIGDGSCTKTCEKNEVNYYLRGDNIAHVEWEVSGGSIAAISGDELQCTVQWDSMGNGYVSFTITLNDQSVIQKVFCVDIIKGPKADFTIAGINEDLSFCAEVPLYFVNNSHSDGGTQLVSYFWDFGDGTFSSEFEPSHIYKDPGTYKVVLIVRNECNCIAKHSIEIKIDRPALPISCPTVVCEGAIEIYTIERTECRIHWKVEGGHIISNPNSNSVQVIWDTVGDEGFGYLSALNECECPLWTTVKIPVIKQNGTILGETELCTKLQYRYKLPQWPGTFYEWSIINLSGNPSGTNVIQTDQLNEAIVSALESGIYILKCIYKNELTGCGGIATLKLDINDNLHINGPSLVCRNTSVSYSSNYSNTTWNLIKDGNSIASGGGANFNYTFNNSGTYLLSATSTNSCADSSRLITVFDNGSLAGTISGDALVCKSLPYTYTMPPLTGLNSYVWTTSGGTIQGSNTGDSVIIIFNDPVPSVGYYEVKVNKQMNEPPFCLTNPIILKVYPKQTDVIIENIDHKTIFCPSSFTSFTFDFDYLNEVEDIVWRVENLLGNSNFGNIIGGQGTNTIQVSWNEISESNLGKVYLDLRFCGKIKTFEFDVSLVTTPTLSWNTLQTSLCAGEFNPFFLAIDSDITIDSGTIVWDLGNGSTYTQQITSPNTTFSSGMLNFQNIHDVDILQTVKVTVFNPNGCNISSVLIGEVTVLPVPKVTITPGHHQKVCPDNQGHFSVNLTANVQGGLTLVGAPKWYKVNGNSPIYVGSGITITITDSHGLGEYFAEAESTNFCTNRSQNVLIYQQCPQSGCSLPFNPIVSASLSSQSNCYSFQLTGSYTHTPYLVEWDFPSTTGMVITSSTDTMANFEVTAPGNYVVFYRVIYQNSEGQLCSVKDSVEIKVPFLADIRYQLSCLGQGAYNVTLWDNSTHILSDTELAGLVYSFYINGVLQQSGSNSSFNTTSLTAGTYTLGVKLTHPDYPNFTSCMAETSLTLYNDPDTSFTITHTPNCTEQQVFLNLNTATTANYRYEWQFDNTSFIIPNPEDGVQQSIINLKESFPEYSEVILRVTDPNGCVFTNSVSTDAVVSKANYDGGVINGASTFCSGEVVILEYNNLSQTPFAYQWMQGNQPILGATSSTYSPTQSGNYWVVVFNSYGCSDRTTPSATVIFYPAPTIVLTAPDAVCANSDFAINATVSSGNLEKRWLLDGLEIQGWSTTTPTMLLHNESIAGVYTFRLEVRDALHNTCSSWEEVVVTVLEAVELQVTYDLFNCNPYQVKLSASASANGGNFIWSNGENGESIEVNAGGAYSVTYIAENGCAVVKQLSVSKDPMVYMWLFPSGCVNLCKEELATKILLPAPNAQFYHYSWNEDNVPDMYGSGFSPLYQIGGNGTLDLILQNELCIAQSDHLYITEIPCKKCNPKFDIKEIKGYDNPYVFFELDASFENNFGTDVIIEISEVHDYGIFNPSSIYIPNGNTEYFNPLVFIPASGFLGGNMTIRILIKDKNGKVICFTDKKVDMPNTNKRLSNIADLKIVPNPVVSIASLEYKLGTLQAGQIRIFDVLGKPITTFDLYTPKGNVTFDGSNLASGNYIVVLIADGKIIQQQILVKK
jgi:PKD repeat protein